jgi:soluble lytic murein transglycosylase-like protein
MAPGAGEPECPPLSDAEAESLAGGAATREGLDVELLVNVMRQESGLRPCAVSAKGAMGLMQLMPSTAQQLGVKDSFDPMENIAAGARYLRELLSRYNGDVFKAVSAYNAGPARVDAAEGIPQIPETLDYVNRILYQDPQ